MIFWYTVRYISKTEPETYFSDNISSVRTGGKRKFVYYGVGRNYKYLAKYSLTGVQLYHKIVYSWVIFSVSQFLCDLIQV